MSGARECPEKQVLRLQLTFGSPMVIAMLTVGAILMIAFVFVEWKVARLPMLPCRYLQTSYYSMVL